MLRSSLLTGSLRWEAKTERACRQPVPPLVNHRRITHTHVYIILVYVLYARASPPRVSVTVGACMPRFIRTIDKRCHAAWLACLLLATRFALKTAMRVERGALAQKPTVLQR